MRPHIGKVNTAMNEGIDASSPDHRSTALADWTPISGRNSGMIGLRKLNEVLMTSWTITMAHIVIRHCGEPSAPVAASAAIRTFVPAIFPHRPHRAGSAAVGRL